MSLVVGNPLSITAIEVLAGRAKFVKAFGHYLDANGHRQDSVMMKNQYKTSAKNGVSVKDVARFEIGDQLPLL